MPLTQNTLLFSATFSNPSSLCLSMCECGKWRIHRQLCRSTEKKKNYRSRSKLRSRGPHRQPPSNRSPISLHHIDLSPPTKYQIKYWIKSLNQFGYKLENHGYKFGCFRETQGEATRERNFFMREEIRRDAKERVILKERDYVRAERIWIKRIKKKKKDIH